MNIAKWLFLCITLVASLEVLAQGRDWGNPAKITNSTSTSFSEETLQVLGLFDNLLHFGPYPKFQKVGFGACCEFKAWSEGITSFSAKGHIVYDEIGVLPGEVWGLAVSYMKNRGMAQSAKDKEIERKLVKALRATGYMGVLSHPELVTAEIQDYVIKPCAQTHASRLGISVGATRKRLSGALRNFSDSVQTQAEGKPYALRKKLYGIGLAMCKAAG